CVGGPGGEPGVQWRSGADPSVPEGRVRSQEPPRRPASPGGHAASALPGGTQQGHHR
ncbi:hypothetical protein M9458_027607, partial [Cirrhinus mrigala]